MSWFSSPAEYRSLYLSYVFYLRRRLYNDIDAETKLKRIQDIRSMLEQGQKFLLESMLIILIEYNVMKLI